MCTESKPYLLVMQFRSVEGKAYTFHRTSQGHTLLLKTQEWFYVIMHIAPEVVAGTHLPSCACYIYSLWLLLG